MTRLLRTASVRFYAGHPWQLALAITGISLGVAVYVGVDLANDSAARAFESASALLRGQTTHRLLAAGGDLDERVYTELVTRLPIAAAAPVVELEAGIQGMPGTRYPVLGIDPLQEAGIRSFTDYVPGRDSDLIRLIAEPGSVLLPSMLAEELGLRSGGRLVLEVNGRSVPVEMVGTVGSASNDVRNEPPIVTDIATAQEMRRREGVISRIDLKLTERQAREIERSLPEGTVLVPVGNENRAFTELAAAFRTNLTALGLLALVVGAFLIYSTMSFAIVQRRTTLGILRALGVTRTAVVRLALLEAVVLGLVATGIGLLVGQLLATTLVDLVLRTIGDLYFSRAVHAAPPSPLTYVRGAALGVVATLVAAAKPAFDAARTPPAAALRRAELERGAHRSAHRAAWAAIPVLAASLLILQFSSRGLYPAFAALFGVVAAGALVVPSATLLLMRAIEGGAGRALSLPSLLAVRGVGASLSRTGVATAALAIAVATVNGVGLMISSFRTSLTDWLETTLTADLYVSLEGVSVQPTNDELASIERIDGVRGLSLTRTVIVPTAAGEIAVRGVRPGPAGWGFEIVSGGSDDALRGLAAGRGVIASERLAFARDLVVGNTISVPTPAGEKSLPILATFRDFNTGSYSIVVSLDWLRREWNDSSLSGIGVSLKEGATTADVQARLAAVLGSPLRIRSTDAIRQASLRIFDRTFQITEVLRILGGVVAFLGVLGALLSIELERARELAILRALGLGPRGLVATLMTQTGLLGLAAGVAAAPIGIALAALLVQVINRRSFGWSMGLSVRPGPLLTGFLLAVGAALLAGIYPAWRAIRTGLGTALREE